LALFRAHTSPASQLSLSVPYLLGGGDPLVGVFLFLLGVPVHWASFGHNSVMDYWYDVRDPNKRHHPLVSGVIKREDALNVVVSMQVVLAVVMVFVAFALSAVYALAALVLYIVFGHAYNDGMGKTTRFSFVPISLCFTSLAAYSYLLARPLDLFGLVLLAWAFLAIFYQIAFEGNIKDVWVEGGLLLRPWLVQRDGKWFLKRHVGLFFALVRGLVSTMLLVFLAMAVAGPVGWVLLAVFTAVEIYLVLSIYRVVCGEGLDLGNRGRLLAFFGAAEAVEFFRVTSLLGVYGVPLIVASIVWFILFNRVLWGTMLSPRV